MWIELTHKNSNQPILVNMNTVQSIIRSFDDSKTVLYYANANEDLATDDVIETVQFIKDKVMWGKV